MAHMMHARKTEEGLRFRAWCSITDSYRTGELTEEEMRAYTLKVAVCDAITEHLQDIDERVQRTKSNGTSSMRGDTRDLNAPWDEEQE